MSDFDVTLGGFTFQRFEVPDRIPFGGEQLSVTHKLLGGVRVVDTFGRDDTPLEFEGRLTGPDALARARQLDAIRIAGAAVTMAWSELSFTVVVKRFVGDFEKPFLIPFRMTLEVVEETSAPVADGASDSLDEQLGSDLDDANGYGDEIGDPSLTSSLTSLGSAVGNVTTFVGASQAALSSALTPLGQAQAQVNTLISANEAETGGSFNGDAATLTSFLTGQTAAYEALTPLYDAQASLGRMATNLVDITTAGAVRTQAGGNLYQIATAAYGDPGQWPVVARANGLTDPSLTGIVTLTVPPAQASTDGVLTS